MDLVYFVFSVEADEPLNRRTTNGLLMVKSLLNPDEIAREKSAFQVVRSSSHHTSTPKQEIRKPRINFHSIDDIVNGGKTNGKQEKCVHICEICFLTSPVLFVDEMEDSGFKSASNSAANASNFETSPKIDNENDDNDCNKENESKVKNIFAATTHTTQIKKCLPLR
jgi:hypothetical protein